MLEQGASDASICALRSQGRIIGLPSPVEQRAQGGTVARAESLGHQCGGRVLEMDSPILVFDGPCRQGARTHGC
jgi:hypothetical protein